ncbi:uncharacterized protein TrAtP1_009920 [Trichoderma atroviride]|uniref:Uncharacterized protein n=1 Tax=Hypocrea atroviridis (strain ATCC 20476 / IMI 206040) TaxID=452589 RepID=G9NEC9_HYPAI|nr:uncharacterized protein TRIATDRAFT_94241 [Trichoderma atroviride IMI 206040]EHK51035.1 hypothetical protein TRIATDRAFT_94241 [Trichoderma atroviride IMI 206040]UKZ68902.1 hypothetical protein TrAtP1_009920 [Trichoderma atroviride]
MSWRSNAGILVRQNGDSLVPALCVEACNEAATAGQQTPQSTLCTSKNFLFFVDQCIRCIKETIDTSPYGATPIPSLLPYLQDCHMQGYTVKNVPVTNGKTSTVTFLMPTDAAAAEVTPTGQSSSSRATSSTSSHIQSGTSTSHTLTSSSSQSVASSLQTSTSSATPSQTPSLQTTPSPNHAWIAGAVIGPLAILAILSLSFYLWKRHKRTNKQLDDDRDSTYGKAQLESATNGIHELDSTPIRGEMPANEAPANEVPANEAPAVELQARHEA